MKPTQRLVEEHDRILRALDVLEALCEGEIDEARARDVVDFIRSFADGLHHGKEEDLLFPALGEAGMPTGGGPIAVMLMEHEEGRAWVREMTRALDAGLPGSRDAFVHAGRSFVGLLRRHIDKENQVLFPMGEGMLDAETREALSLAFDEHDQEKHAEEYRRCLRLYESLIA